MNRKCEKCGADMVELFSSWVCSKDCKGDTPLETPEGDFTYAANIKDNPKYPERCVKGDELMPPQEHNRSGSYPAPTEEEIQKQKKKMLKTLANFNTTAWRLIGQMDRMLIGIDNVTIAFKKLKDAITQDITFAQDQLVNFDRWQTSIHSGVFDVYQHKTMPVYRIEPRHTINNQEEFCDLVISDPSFAQPIQNVKWDHIDTSFKAIEEKIIRAMGIPSHIMNAEDEKVRGQRATQIVIDEYCNLDTSIYDSVISSLKDGDFDIEKEKLKIQIEKLSPEDGDLIVFRMPPSASDKDYRHLVKMLDELELDAKSIVIPDSITVEHVPLSKDKDNDNSKE